MDSDSMMNGGEGMEEIRAVKAVGKNPPTVVVKPAPARAPWVAKRRSQERRQ